MSFGTEQITLLHIESISLESSLICTRYLQTSYLGDKETLLTSSQLILKAITGMSYSYLGVNFAEPSQEYINYCPSVLLVQFEYPLPLL
jgi:hypothetical protein